MSAKTLGMYLSNLHYEKTQKNGHRYLNGVKQALEDSGFKIRLRKIHKETKYTAGLFEDYAILDKLLTSSKNTFTLRRSIFVPFWSVENGEYRDEMRLFNLEFDEASIDPEEAQTYASQLRKKHLGTPDPITPSGDAIFVPLQGQLGNQRRGQSMSPVDMLRQIRQYEPNREILVTLHPRQIYTKADEAVLSQALKDTDAKLVQTPSKTLLQQSQYVATMNSSLGFEALTFGVPSLLFADADYHHATINMSQYQSNPQAAFETIKNQSRNFDAYVTWYLRDNMVHATQPNAVKRTLQYLRQLGMDIPESQKK